ncbi:uncharacterized protein [Clytia hemisphaerica]|uniref:Myb-like domain-containing protein n=1 Tax=Clytia hemisphaerica TaxID=252671 RepID=A0A7M5UE90_9CNID
MRTPRKEDGNPSPMRTPRKSWSTEEDAIIQSALSNGTPFKDINVDASPRQIRDHVRHIKRKGRNSSDKERVTIPVSATLNEEDEHDHSTIRMAPRSPPRMEIFHTEGDRHSLWPPVDVLTLEKYGQDFIDKKQKMNDKSIKQLGYLSEKYSLQQIRSRVQHQRNKQAKEKDGEK